MSDAGRAATEAVLTEALDDVPATLREPCRRLAYAGGGRLRAGLVLTVAGRAWSGTIDEAAAARPELAEQARRYRDSRLALVLPRYRSLLSS